VLSFNRGHWCPYCRLEVRALKELHPDISAAGGRLFSIVPETAAFSERMRQASDLPFGVLTDVDLGYALSLGLAFWVGRDVTEIYQSRGIDLPRYQGNNHWLLPIPATFVVAPDGRITASHVDAEFRRKMSIENIRKAINGAGRR
jgi:peroxiredoxin